MKNLLFFFAAILLFASCNELDNNGHAYVTFGQAFAHHLHNPVYVIASIASLLLLAGYCFYIVKLSNSADITIGHIIGGMALLVLFLMILLISPIETHLNTSVEAAARGNWI